MSDSRLKQIRKLRGLKVTQAAEKLGITRGELHKLEKGDRRLTDVWLQRLARLYDVAPLDLISHEGISIPVKHIVAAAFHDIPLPYDVPPEQQERFQPPRFVQRPEECFGLDVVDDSADRSFPPGTRLIARGLAGLGRRLRKGDEVAIRHFAGTRAEGKTLEILVGVLDIAVTGDLIVLVPSNNRQVRGPIEIRHGAPAAGLGDAPRAYEADGIDYAPQPGDRAEILGVIEGNISPRR